MLQILIKCVLQRVTNVFVVGYSFLAEGTTNATWGGSTQGTLDDLAEQDDIQEQSAGYSRLVDILALDCTSLWFWRVSDTDTTHSLLNGLVLGGSLEMWLLAVNFGCIITSPELFCGCSKSLQVKVLL